MQPKVINTKGKLRGARGFSKTELKEVGLTVKQARAKEIPVDKKRKTKYDFNTEELKNFLKQG